jgi:hypothetical protein
MSGPFPVIQCREDALSLVTDSVFEVAVYQRVESVAFNGGEDRLGGRSCARSWSIDRCAGRRSVNTSSTASVKVNRSAVIGVRARALRSAALSHRRSNVSEIENTACLLAQ